jgi:uncharacterized OB-fold protein
MANSQPFISLLDEPLWASIEDHRWALQACSDCGTFRYPPAPVCANCLSMSSRWTPLSGRGSIISWVIFHRQYFDDYPPPYNVVAVQLEEGPLVISNLEGEEPDGSWLGRPVEVTYGRHSSGRAIPKMKLRHEAKDQAV